MVSQEGAIIGKTGWMFVKQVDPILAIQPTAFVLEMVSSAAQVHDGSEVDEVCSRLSKKYHVHKMDRLRTWTMGDVSNRSRMFIVGFHRERVGQEGERFRFPSPVYDSTRFPIAADLAIPDEEVYNK